MRRRGYTLLELVIVVGLLALLATFLMPILQQLLSQAQLTSAINQTADFLRLTEQKSVTEQQMYGVTLTAGATTIPQFIYDPVAQTKAAQTTLALPNNIDIGAASFAGNSDIRFSYFGAPNASGTLTLTDTVRSKNRDIIVGPTGVISTNGSEY